MSEANDEAIHNNALQINKPMESQAIDEILDYRLPRKFYKLARNDTMGESQ